MAAKQKPGVMVYFDDIRPSLSMLDDARLGKLFRSIVEYAEDGVIPELDDMGKLAFEMLRPKIDRDGLKYEEKRLHSLFMVYCRQMKEIGQEPLTETEWRNQLTVTGSNRQLPTAIATATAVTTTTTTEITSETTTEKSTALASGKAGARGIKGTGEENPLSAEELDAKKQKMIEALRNPS